MGAITATDAGKWLHGNEPEEHGLAVVKPRAAPSLYELAEDLLIWLDSREMTEPDSPERAECDKAVDEFTGQLASKVDSMAWMLAHLESQVKLAADEIKRLQKRKQFFENSVEALEAACVRVLEKLPEPKRGPRKLQGRTSSLSITPSDRAIPNDEAAIDSRFKTAVIEMRAPDWELLLDLQPDVAGAALKHELKIRLADIKKALKAGEEVSGAELRFCNNLSRK